MVADISAAALDLRDTAAAQRNDVTASDELVLTKVCFLLHAWEIVLIRYQRQLIRSCAITLGYNQPVLVVEIRAARFHSHGKVFLLTGVIKLVGLIRALVVVGALDVIDELGTELLHLRVTFVRLT